MLPLLGNGLFREDGGYRAGGLAVAALDADVRIDVEHLGRLESLFVLSRMDAVDRADVDARRVLGADARLRDDVHPHPILLAAAVPRPVRILAGTTAGVAERGGAASAARDRDLEREVAAARVGRRLVADGHPGAGSQSAVDPGLRRPREDRL